jgi:hypothetical protein
MTLFTTTEAMNQNTSVTYFPLILATRVEEARKEHII